MDAHASAAALLAAGRPSAALDEMRAALERRPDDAVLLNNAANALCQLWRFPDAAPVYQALVARTAPPLRDRVISNYLTQLQYQPQVPDAALTQAARDLGARLGDADMPPRAACRGRPLRVGFVSADLCEHPVGFLLLPLLQQLDRQRIEPVLVSVGGRADGVAAQLRDAAAWRDFAELDTASLVAALRAEALDVAIDLSGHTAGNRLPAFARRVAPVQVSWLGYFATTGVPAMDAVLMDRWHAPEGAQALFTEREVVRLPGCRFPYAPVPFAPQPAPPPVLRNGFVTFGSFNNTAKYNAGVIAAWADILRRLPQSRLVLKWLTFADDEVRATIHRAFADAGIDPARVELREASPHAEVLRQYADIDVALDPFPFTGGHTTCEALWMGVPVVTWPQVRPVSRQSLALIAGIGRDDWLRDWVASDAAGYAGKAVRLAADTRRLVEIRSSLRPTMRGSSLMDVAQFARGWEQAIERLARAHGVLQNP